MSGKAGPENSTALQSRQSWVPAEVALARTLALGPHSTESSPHNVTWAGVDPLFQLSRQHSRTSRFLAQAWSPRFPDAAGTLWSLLSELNWPPSQLGVGDQVTVTSLHGGPWSQDGPTLRLSSCLSLNTSLASFGTCESTSGRRAARGQAPPT